MESTRPTESVRSTAGARNDDEPIAGDKDAPRRSHRHRPVDQTFQSFSTLALDRRLFSAGESYQAPQHDDLPVLPGEADARERRLE